MSNFVPKKEHFREVLIHFFILNKTSTESYRILYETYGEHAPSQTTCKEWFQRFKNDNFDVKDKPRPGQPKKFKDTELQALLNEGSCQTQVQLAEQLGVAQQTVSDRLKAMGKILIEPLDL